MGIISLGMTLRDIHPVRAIMQEDLDMLDRVNTRLEHLQHQYSLRLVPQGRDLRVRRDRPQLSMVHLRSSRTNLNALDAGDLIREHAELMVSHVTSVARWAI